MNGLTDIQYSIKTFQIKKLFNQIKKLKMEKFLNRVAELARMDVNDLASQTYRQVINNVVLPVILRPTGQDIRGWRIGDDYMAIIAEFGRECWLRDNYTGEILLEIALQRLSCGAVLHEGHSFKILPEAYWKYSAMCDQYGLMDDACWEFLKKQANTCFQASLTKEHIVKIVFGLLDHLDEEGNELKGYMLKYSNFHTDTKEVYQWAWNFAVEHFSFEEMYAHFATPQNWQRFIPFFKLHKGKIDKSDFCHRIGVEGFWNKRKVWKSL